MNPYEELGLPSNATYEEIRQRYKSLAQQHHPDRGGDEEKFKRIKLAYEILIDPQTRNEYDSTGTVNQTRTYRSSAIEDLCVLARSLISRINPDQDDLIAMMKLSVNEFRRNIHENIRSCKLQIFNSKKIVDKIKLKDDGYNFIRHIAEEQLNQKKQYMEELESQIKVNDEMLKLLEQYHYGSEEFKELL